MSISESATIAAIAQLPSRINPVKNPRRTLQRRDWILSRMYSLEFISKKDFLEALSEEIKINKNINLYKIDAKHLAELTRQEVINRYGLRAYKEGWSVYTTIDSNSQKIALQSMLDELFLYDKRHGWREPKNYKYIFSTDQVALLKETNISFLFDDSYFGEVFLDKNTTSNRLTDIFDSYPFYESHIKAIVVNLTSERIDVIDENFELKSIYWSMDYKWARKQISVNEMGSVPKTFTDFLKFGDFIYIKKNEDSYIVDQIPIIESSLISINPDNGDVIAYIGGKTSMRAILIELEVHFHNLDLVLNHLYILQDWQMATIYQV